MSTQFNIAIALTTPGLVLKHYFKEPHLSDSRLKKLAAKLRIIQTPEATAAYPGEWRHDITIELKNGKSATGRVAHPKGHPENPLSPDEVCAKFRELADGVIGDKAATRVVETVLHLEDASARDLGDLLQGG